MTQDYRAVLNKIIEAETEDFFELAKITGLDPAKDLEAGNMQAITDAWIKWGIEKGLIS